MNKKTRKFTPQNIIQVQWLPVIIRTRSNDSSAIYNRGNIGSRLAVIMDFKTLGQIIPDQCFPALESQHAMDRHNSYLQKKCVSLWAWPCFTHLTDMWTLSRMTGLRPLLYSTDLNYPHITSVPHRVGTHRSVMNCSIPVIMFRAVLGQPDPHLDPLVTRTDPAPDPAAPDPALDPSIIKQN